MRFIFISLSIILLSLSSYAEKLKVLTTTLPNYLFIKEVGKDLIEMDMLIPPGTDMHHYEPSPKDAGKLSKAKVFFYTNDTLEPWAPKMAQKISKNLKVQALTEKGDPHRWLDPLQAKEMVSKIAGTLSSYDQKNSSAYSDNKDKFIQQLKELDEKYSFSLKKFKGKSIVYIGHQTFNQLAQRYGITFLTPYHSTTTEGEPTPGDVAKIINYIKSNKIKYLFYEKGEDSRMVDLIAKESGAVSIPLDALHGLTKDSSIESINYISVMEDNLEKILKGLKNE